MRCLKNEGGSCSFPRRACRAVRLLDPVVGAAGLYVRTALVYGALASFLSPSFPLRSPHGALRSEFYFFFFPVILLLVFVVFLFFVVLFFVFLLVFFQLFRIVFPLAVSSAISSLRRRPSPASNSFVSSFSSSCLHSGLLSVLSFSSSSSTPSSD